MNKQVVLVQLTSITVRIAADIRCNLSSAPEDVFSLTASAASLLLSLTSSLVLARLLLNSFSGEAAWDDVLLISSLMVLLAANVWTR